MKKIILFIAVAMFFFSAISCTKVEMDQVNSDEVSDAVLAKIAALGLTSKGAYKTDGGYIAEGDIFLDDAMLNAIPEQKSFIVADVEHYRTTNLVTGLPRTIRVRYSGTTTAISNAINTAISRYNALPLTLKFSRVTSNANITISLNVKCGEY